MNLGYSKERSLSRCKRKKKIKNTKGGEEKALMIEIWSERDHVSELSGIALGYEINVAYFAHILPKGTYPDMKLDKDNIMLLTFDEHYTVDHETHKAKIDPMYKPFFDKFDRLKIKQHG